MNLFSYLPSQTKSLRRSQKALRNTVTAREYNHIREALVTEEHLQCWNQVSVIVQSTGERFTYYIS